MVSDKWKMVLRVKNFKLDISTTPRQNSLRSVSSLRRQKQISHCPQLNWRIMKTESTFSKHVLLGD